MHGPLAFVLFAFLSPISTTLILIEQQPINIDAPFPPITRLDSSPSRQLTAGSESPRRIADAGLDTMRRTSRYSSGPLAGYNLLGGQSLRTGRQRTAAGTLPSLRHSSERQMSHNRRTSRAMGQRDNRRLQGSRRRELKMSQAPRTAEMWSAATRRSRLRPATRRNILRRMSHSSPLTNVRRRNIQQSINYDVPPMKARQRPYQTRRAPSTSNALYGSSSARKSETGTLAQLQRRINRQRERNINLPNRSVRHRQRKVNRVTRPIRQQQRRRNVRQSKVPLRTGKVYGSDMHTHQRRRNVNQPNSRLRRPQQNAYRSSKSPHKQQKAHGPERYLRHGQRHEYQPDSVLNQGVKQSSSRDRGNNYQTGHGSSTPDRVQGQYQHSSVPKSTDQQVGGGSDHALIHRNTNTPGTYQIIEGRDMGGPYKILRSDLSAHGLHAGDQYPQIVPYSPYTAFPDGVGPSNYPTDMMSASAADSQSRQVPSNSGPINDQVPGLRVTRGFESALPQSDSQLSHPRRHDSTPIDPRPNEPTSSGANPLDSGKPLSKFDSRPTVDAAYQVRTQDSRPVNSGDPSSVHISLSVESPILESTYDPSPVGPSKQGATRRDNPQKGPSDLGFSHDTRPSNDPYPSYHSQQAGTVNAGPIHAASYDSQFIGMSNSGSISAGSAPTGTQNAGPIPNESSHSDPSGTLPYGHAYVNRKNSAPVPHESSVFQSHVPSSTRSTEPDPHLPPNDHPVADMYAPAVHDGGYNALPLSRGGNTMASDMSQTQTGQTAPIDGNIEGRQQNPGSVQGKTSHQKQVQTKGPKLGKPPMSSSGGANLDHGGGAIGGDLYQPGSAIPNYMHSANLNAEAHYIDSGSHTSGPISHGTRHSDTQKAKTLPHDPTHGNGKAGAPLEASVYQPQLPSSTGQVEPYPDLPPNGPLGADRYAPAIHDGGYNALPLTHGGSTTVADSAPGIMNNRQHSGSHDHKSTASSGVSTSVDQSGGVVSGDFYQPGSAIPNYMYSANLNAEAHFVDSGGPTAGQGQYEPHHTADLGPGSNPSNGGVVLNIDFVGSDGASATAQSSGRSITDGSDPVSAGTGQGISSGYKLTHVAQESISAASKSGHTVQDIPSSGIKSGANSHSITYDLLNSKSSSQNVI